MKVYCVDEDSCGVIGLAKDYPAIIKNLIKEKWIDENTKMSDDYGNSSTIKKVFGLDWEKVLLSWDIETFNINFEGSFYIYSMEV